MPISAPKATPSTAVTRMGLTVVSAGVESEIEKQRGIHVRRVLVAGIVRRSVSRRHGIHGLPIHIGTVGIAPTVGRCIDGAAAQGGRYNQRKSQAFRHALGR